MSPSPQQLPRQLQPLMADPSGTSLACGSPLSSADFADLRMRTIFDCGKFDPQLGDIAVLSRFPLLINADEFQRLANWAQLLAAETLAGESELLGRPDLHHRLGLRRSIRRALAGCATQTPAHSAARHMRFDFHPTLQGWKISEVNSDVPGGFIEASGFTRLMAGYYPDAKITGDPTAALADALAAVAPAGAAVGLVHATAYADDRQVMSFLDREMRIRDLQPVLIAPDQLRWVDGRASCIADWHREPLDLLMRFFPGEWLANLPNCAGWKYWFNSGKTPMSNPATALLTQTKRFPLVWDELSTPLPTWRKLLPRTVDPAEVNIHDQAWVLKPALGRVGSGIGLQGVTSSRDWRAICRSAFWHRSYWAAQARFEAVPIEGPDGPVYPCLGIYTIDGRAAGIYGRIARQPLIDDQAQDIAVLQRRLATNHDHQKWEGMP